MSQAKLMSQARLMSQAKFVPTAPARLLQPLAQSKTTSSPSINAQVSRPVA